MYFLLKWYNQQKQKNPEKTDLQHKTIQQELTFYKIYQPIIISSI